MANEFSVFLLWPGQSHELQSWSAEAWNSGTVGTKTNYQ